MEVRIHAEELLGLTQYQQS